MTVQAGPLMLFISTGSMVAFGVDRVTMEKITALDGENLVTMLDRYTVCN
jgi:hypothetical protein